MTDTRRVLELALHPASETGAPLPHAVLENLLRDAGATSGAIGRGQQVLARVGPTGGGPRRAELPGGRDVFWIELGGGAELAEPVRVAAGVVLGGWVLREELKQARFAERRRLWEIESLRAIGEALGGTLEPARIAEELLLHATALLDARRGEVWLTAAGVAGPAVRLTGAVAVALCASGECTMAARVGGAVLGPEEAAALPDGGLLESGRLAVPVAGRRGRLGVLALAEREVRGGTAPFAVADGETLALFAAQAAVALENATLHREALEQERTERELELAAAIQRQLVPATLPTLPGFDLAAKSEPSRRVGGDVYDVLASPNGIFLMLGDVAGKGVPAALMAASLQAAVRLLARTWPPLDELARELHLHLLHTIPEGKFATVFLAYLGRDGTLDWVSAGHNPVLLVGPGGEYDRLLAVGPPLGLLENSVYPCSRTVVQPGALLLAYTDGLSEAPAPDEDGDEFGIEGIAACTVVARNERAERLVADLFAAVTAHTAGAPPHDDRTVLAARRLAG